MPIQSESNRSTLVGSLGSYVRCGEDGDEVLMRLMTLMTMPMTKMILVILLFRLKADRMSNTHNKRQQEAMSKGKARGMSVDLFIPISRSLMCWKEQLTTSFTVSLARPILLTLALSFLGPNEEDSVSPEAIFHCWILACIHLAYQLF